MRLMHALHEAHLENRWHRQYLGGTLRVKTIMLLWCGRVLHRCWLAWGAHMVRVRMQREVRNELRQLAYTLRVASLSRDGSVLASFRRVSSQNLHMHRPRDLSSAAPATQAIDDAPTTNGGIRYDHNSCMGSKASLENPLDSYVVRLAWMGWTFLVATSKIEHEYAQACRQVKDESAASVFKPSSWEELERKYTPPGCLAVEWRLQADGAATDPHLESGPSTDTSPLADVACGRDELGTELSDEPIAPVNGMNPDISATLMRWLSTPLKWSDEEIQKWSGEEELPETEITSGLVDSRLVAICRARTLALFFCAWRFALAHGIFVRQKEAETSALLVSLWRATTCGLLGSRGATSHTSSLGTAVLRSESSSDDDASTWDDDIHMR